MYKMETQSILYQSKKVQEILSSTQYIINFNATSLKYLSKFVEVIIHATLATTATVLSSSYSLIADLYREYDCRSQDGRTACYRIGD